MRFLVLIMFFSIATELSAQKLGFKLGGTWNSLGAANASRNLNLDGAYLGWLAGLYVKIGKKWIFLEPGVMLVKKGFNQRTDILIFTAESRYRMTYLEVPVHVNLKLLALANSDMPGLTFYAGPVGSLLLGAHGQQDYKILTGILSTTFDRDELGFNNFELAWNAGFRFHFPFGLSLGAGYYRAFTNVLDANFISPEDPFANLLGTERGKNYVNWNVEVFLTYTLPKFKLIVIK